MLWVFYPNYHKGLQNLICILTTDRKRAVVSVVYKQFIMIKGGNHQVKTVSFNSQADEQTDFGSRVLFIQPFKLCLGKFRSARAHTCMTLSHGNVSRELLVNLTLILKRI